MMCNRCDKDSEGLDEKFILVDDESDRNFHAMILCMTCFTDELPERIPSIKPATDDWFPAGVFDKPKYKDKHDK